MQYGLGTEWPKKTITAGVGRYRERGVQDPPIRPPLPDGTVTPASHCRVPSTRTYSPVKHSYLFSRPVVLTLVDLTIALDY